MKAMKEKIVPQKEKGRRSRVLRFRRKKGQTPRALPSPSPSATHPPVCSEALGSIHHTPHDRPSPRGTLTCFRTVMTDRALLFVQLYGEGLQAADSGRLPQGLRLGVERQEWTTWGTIA